MWTLALSAFLAILFAAAMAWAYRTQRNLVRRRALDNLVTVAYSRSSWLREWYLVHLRDASVIASGMGRIGDGDLWRRDPARIRDDLARRASEMGFDASGFLDANGRLLPWSLGGDSGLLNAAEFLPAEAFLNQPHFLPFSLAAREKVRLLLIVPIPEASPPAGSPCAILLAVDPWKRLFGHMAFFSSPTAPTSLEVSLIQREGDFIEYVTPSASRHLSPLGRRVPLTPGSPPALAVQGEILEGECKDYRGIPILYATQYVPGAGWGILAQQDQSEAFVTLRFSFFLMLLAAILAALALAFSIYALRSRKARLALAALLQTVRGQKASLEQAMTRLARVQDTERRRLSRELHDEMIQDLNAAKLRVEGLQAEWGTLPAPEVIRHLGETQKALGGSITRCRTIWYHLRPPQLQARGLPKAIESLALNLLPFSVHLDIPTETDWRDLPESYSASLYGAARETLLNAWRHSGASGAEMSLRKEPAAILLEVADDGAGFDPALRKKDHFGLLLAREDVELLGGSLEIESAPGKGTRVRIRIPLPEPE